MKMIDKIDEAVFEARRFIRRATEWRKILKKDKSAVYGSKQGGACKRSSMDLTRALAELRKGPY
jgi:hypothetical protein